MRVKTSGLDGIALDWAVAKCENRGFCISRPDLLAQNIVTPIPFSTDWAHAGPIIEREKISIELCFSGSYCEGCFATPTGWKAVKYKRGGAFNAPAFRGPTPLIAAMRCYVASKLGDEVEIPDEIENFSLRA